MAGAFRSPFGGANMWNVQFVSRIHVSAAFIGTPIRQQNVQTRKLRGFKQSAITANFVAASSFRHKQEIKQWASKANLLVTSSECNMLQREIRHRNFCMSAGDGSSNAGGVNGFAALGLDYRLVNALSKMGLTTPTRVQQATIPSILQGSDVVMGAETGSGKTLAYLLPILHRLLQAQDSLGLGYDDQPEALVLVPNQELAHQVMSVLQSLPAADPELAFPAIVLAGSAGLPRAKQCAIVIATASGVVRHTQPSFFDTTAHVVVDEADMMLDGGFLDDVTRILDTVKPRVSNTLRRQHPRATDAELRALLPRAPAQAVFAAATLPDWTGDKVKSVVRWLRQHYPAAAHISTDRLHLESDRVRQDWVDVGGGQDPLAALAAALDRVAARRSMVFVNTVARAKEAQAFLEALGRRTVLAVHKEVPAAERAAGLQAFRGAAEGEQAVLVCTDLAARGIDIPAVGHVVQLDFAPNAVTHLHRVGRTGRAGASGVVTNLVDDAARPVAEAIQREGGQPLAPIFSRNRGFRRRLLRTGSGRAQAGEEAGEAPAPAPAAGKDGKKASKGGT